MATIPIDPRRNVKVPLSSEKFLIGLSQGDIQECMDDINIQLALNEDTSAKILAEFDRLDERFEVMEGELRTASASAGQVISVLKELISFLTRNPHNAASEPV